MSKFPDGYYCDDQRHLVCVPYSIQGLHEMALFLDLKRCWFHTTKGLEHYDIPKRRIKEITKQCTVVSARDIVRICRGF